jgi:hypothetical protein
MMDYQNIRIQNTDIQNTQNYADYAKPNSSAPSPETEKLFAQGVANDVVKALGAFIFGTLSFAEMPARVLTGQIPAGIHQVDLQMASAAINKTGIPSQEQFNKIPKDKIVSFIKEAGEIGKKLMDDLADNKLYQVDTEFANDKTMEVANKTMTDLYNRSVAPQYRIK